MINSFINAVVNQKFLFCTILVLGNHENNQISINKFISSTPTQVKYTLSLKAHNVTKFPKVIFCKECQSIKFKLESHFKDPCVVTVTFVPIVNQGEFLNCAKSIIAPDFMPVTRMDYDYFIIIAPSTIHAKLLLSDSFVKKIKFKLAAGIGEDNKLQLTTVDFFGSPEGLPKLATLSQESDNYFPDFVQNLHGKIVRISCPGAKALVECYTPKYPSEVGNAKRGRWKYLFEEYLMVRFNLTYQMIPSTGGGTGRQLTNGTWIGVTGDLAYGRADFGIGIANTDKRIQVIGFTDSIFDTACLTFVTGRSTKLYTPKALLWPLHLNLWIGIVAITSTILFSTAIFAKQLKNVSVEKSTFHSFYQVLFVFAPLLEQDMIYLPRSHSLRSLFTFWYIFAIIVTNVYRSKLVTQLAFPIFGEIPQTFGQLAFSSFQVGFMKDSDSAYNTLRNGNDPVYVELLKKMEILKGVNLECLDKTLHNPNYACIAYDVDVAYLLQKNFTEVSARKLQVSKAQTCNIWMGLSMQPHSIYKANFDKVLGQTRPFHLWYVWDQMDVYENIKKPKMKWWKEANHTSYLRHATVQDIKEHTLLALKNIEGVFHLYIYLILVSIVVLGFELHRIKLLALLSDYLYTVLNVIDYF